ncbi:unnamed protein product [Bursaphelenchus okinawaensis]|uniref:Uncharacterized protein n=1 Tax=Bursaphelenchus okinawaensis TaxID=465554 RepID=A0A811KW61_9BILA|nr:unnamed protein product [Bursaphelenchus okinawaensis]CAG9114270.1 unnamed protein product [Bursaphelenchus okinawaensis]
MQPMANYVSLGSYKPADRFNVTPRRAYRQKGGYAVTNKLENLLTPNPTSTITGSVLSSRAPSTVTLNQSSNQSSVPSGPVSPATARQYEPHRHAHYDFNQHYPSEDNLAKHRLSAAEVGLPKLRVFRSGYEEGNGTEIGGRYSTQSDKPVLACELQRPKPPTGLIDLDKEFQRVYNEFRSMHGSFGKPGL